MKKILSAALSATMLVNGVAALPLQAKGMDVVEAKSKKVSNKKAEFTESWHAFSRPYEDSSYLHYGFALTNPNTDQVIEDLSVKIVAKNEDGKILKSETLPIGSIKPQDTYWYGYAVSIDEEPAEVEIYTRKGTFRKATKNDMADKKALTLSNVSVDKDEYSVKVTGEIELSEDYKKQTEYDLPITMTTVLKEGDQIVGIFSDYYTDPLEPGDKEAFEVRGNSYGGVPNFDSSETYANIRTY